MKPKPIPEPRPVSIVCTLCGLRWESHPEKPSVLDCIELLKAALQRAPQVTWTSNSGTGTRG